MPRKRKPGNISQKDWESVDSPPLTAKQLSALRPLAETYPDLASASVSRKRSQQSPKKSPPKVSVTLRVSPTAIVAYKAGGPSYKTCMAAVLEKHVR